MGNDISNDRYPEIESLSMSNGLTEVVYSTMAMATSLLATTPWEVRLARWWSRQDQASPFSGYGNIGFDLDELGWTDDAWPEQRRFLLQAVTFARAGAHWLLQDTVNFEFLDRALAKLFALVDVIDARITAPRPPGPYGDKPFTSPVDTLPEDDAPSACLIHGAYLHTFGCIACYTLGDSDVVTDRPWVQAARDGIPVRRHKRQMTRRSFAPDVLAALRPKRESWRAAYEHVLAAFSADPFDLIATTHDRDAYELEARHYLAEWASGRPLRPAELLSSILETSFASAPRFPGRLGHVLQHLEHLDETLIGLCPRTEPTPIHPTIWSHTPDRDLLSHLAPPPPPKGPLALARATVFPEVGEELIGFLRLENDWMNHIHLGPPDASARISIAVERPLEWAHAGCGNPDIAYPGSGLNFGRQRFTLSEVRPWLDQSHIHLVVLGPEDNVLRILQVPMGPEPSVHTADDPSGEAQFASLRANRIHGDTKTTIEVTIGRVDIDTNPFARLRHLRDLPD